MLVGGHESVTRSVAAIDDKGCDTMTGGLVTARVKPTVQQATVQRAHAAGGGGRAKGARLKGDARRGCVVVDMWCEAETGLIDDQGGQRVIVVALCCSMLSECTAGGHRAVIVDVGTVEQRGQHVDGGDIEWCRRGRTRVSDHDVTTAGAPHTAGVIVDLDSEALCCHAGEVIARTIRVNAHALGNIGGGEATIAGGLKCGTDTIAGAVASWGTVLRGGVAHANNLHG